MYQERTFSLPVLEGISEESVKEHLTLYAGYVKNFNALQAAQEELRKDSEKNAHAISEIVRRLSFEFDGMRLHEHYFAQWEGGAKPLDAGSGLMNAINAQYGSFEEWEKRFKNIGLMRGVGWAILYFDPQAGLLHNAWISEQHQGHFATLPMILGLDMWEHSFLKDYGATGKKPYIDAFFKNLNWSVAEERFAKLA